MNQKENESIYSKLSVSGFNWVIKSEQINNNNLALAKKNNLHPIITKILENRVPKEDFDIFINPKIKYYLSDPFVLKDMGSAVDIILNILDSSDKIRIIGDYDVDGVTSTSLLKLFFDELKIKCDYVIPNRFEDGYGPHESMVNKAIEDKISILILVDCGSLAQKMLEHAEENAVKVIVIDHHIAEKPYPKISSFINPTQCEDNSNLNDLCAVGLTFFFLVGIIKKIREQREISIDLLKYLDLVALGTYCDMVPLKGVNRAFVIQGLKILDQENRVGLKSLSSLLEIKPPFKPYHLGFVLGPCINACGRMENADVGVDFLCSVEEELSLQLSKLLQQYNLNRRMVEKDLTKITLKLASKQKTSVILLQGNQWHEGVIGIIASRVKDIFHKPVCVVSVKNGIGKGSARSIKGFNLGYYIQEAVKIGIIEKGGGHAMAAGFTVLEKNINKFHQFLNQKIDCMNIIPNLNIDAEISWEVVDINFYNSLEKMQPFGAKNSQPCFLIRDLLLTNVKIVGEYHIRCYFKTFQGDIIEGMLFKGIYFPWISTLLNGTGNYFDVVCFIKKNEWNGKVRLQIHVEDLKINSLL